MRSFTRRRLAGNRRKISACFSAFASLILLAPAAAPGAEKSGAFESIVAPSGPRNPRNTEADMLELDGGRLLLAWSEFSSEQGSDWDSARISARESVDGGRTWGPKFVLQENIGKMNTYSPDLLRLKSGRILFLFFRKNSEADCQPMARISEDGGKTFSPPREVATDPYPGYNGINNDRAIQLRSGRVLLPVWFTRDYRANPRIQIRIYHSDDEGVSWKHGPQILDVKESSVGADEPLLVERKDGSVLMWIRTKTGHPYRSVSTNAGLTWSVPEAVPIDAPNAPQSMKRLPSTGDLLLVWNHSPDKRTPLSTAISKDEGQTWQHIKNLESDADHSFAYTSILFWKDRVLLTYWVGPPATSRVEKDRVWSLKFKSIPIDWLYE